MMTTWRNMTAAEKTQFKYEERQARRAFERAAQNSTKGRFGFAVEQRSRASMRQQRLNRLRAQKRIIPKDTISYVGLYKRDDGRPSQFEQGVGETERRRKQINREQLKTENGLVYLGHQT